MKRVTIFILLISLLLTGCRQAPQVAVSEEESLTSSVSKEDEEQNPLPSEETASSYQQEYEDPQPDETTESVDIPETTQQQTNGKPTRRGTIRADIDRAIAASTTESQFIKVLQEMGYELNTRTSKGEPLKYPSLKPPGAKGAFRFHKLGAGYSLEEIKDRIYDNMRRKVPFPEAEREEAKRKRRAQGFVSYEKPKGLRALYIRYCFELKIIVQHPTSVKRVSFLLREDVTKLDRFDAQVRLLNREGIDTLEQLTAYQTDAEAKISSLAEQRVQLRNDLKRASRSGNTEDAAAIKAQIAAVSKEIRKLRKEVGLSSGP